GRVRLLDIKPSDPRAPEPLEMRHRTQRATEVRGQHANVGPLRALDGELDMLGVAKRHLEPPYLDLPRRTLDRDATPRELVKRHPFPLEGRKHRGNLPLRADEARARGCHLV